MIDANRYRAPTLAVAEAIAKSKRSGGSVRIVARGDIFWKVNSELYRECEGIDDDGTCLRFIGKDVEGEWWTVELSDLDLDDDEASAAAESGQQPTDTLAELGARDPDEYEGNECYDTCPSCKRQVNVRYMTKPVPGWPSMCLRCDDEGPPSE